MLISAFWHVLPWCLHGMLVTCFGRKNWRIEHSKVLYTPVSQPCSKRPVWVPFPLNANELLRAQPKDGICTAHFFPPAEDVRMASCYYGNTWGWGRNGCLTTNCGATLYVRAGVSVGRLWVFFAGVSVSRLCVCALLGWVLWPGASCTKLAYAQKSCVRHFSRKRLDVQRLTWREKVRFSTQTKCLAYAHFCCILSVGGT